MSHILRVVKVFVSLMLMLQGGFVFAAGSSQDALTKLADDLLAPKRQSLENKLEDRARQILSAQLDTGTYLVTVASELDVSKVVALSTQRKNLSLKSLAKRLSPEDLVTSFADLQTVETLQPHLKKITVKLSLDKQVPKNVESLILSALTEALGLDTKRGDEIKVTRATLGNMTTAKAQEKLSEFGSTLRRVQDEKQSLEIKLAAFETQKIQFQEQLRAAHSETDRVKAEKENEISKLNEQIAGLKEQIKQLEDNALGEGTFLGKVRRNIRGFEMLVTFVPVAVLIILGLMAVTLLFVASHRKRSQTMFDGMQIVASALQKAGLRGLSSLPSAKAQVAKENTALLDTQTSNLGEGALEIGRAEANEAWAFYSENPYPILSVLKDWLETSEGALRFLAFSEALGFARARELWKVFPAHDLENVTKMSNEVISKNVAFGAVSQVLRLAEAQRSVQPPALSKIDLSFLIGLTDDEFAKVLAGTPTEVAAFGLIAVSAERAKRVLMRMENPAIEELFAKMAEYKNIAEARAVKFASQLKEVSARMSGSAGANLATHFATLIEGASPEQKSRMVRALEKETELVEQIRSRVVSIEDVLALDKDVLIPFFEPLEPTQIAELVFTLPQNLQGVVASLLTQKITVEVQQELARFSSRPALAHKAQVAGRKLQEMLCEAVKAQIDSGEIAPLKRRPSRQAS